MGAAMVETKDTEVATDMAAARVTAVAKAMEETMVATRAMVAATGATKAMVAATEATRATVVTKGMTRTRATAETKATVAPKATEETKDMANSLMAATKDMASSLMAATKDTDGNRAVTTTRATAAGAREGMQRTSTAGKPPDTPHDSSKNWLV